MRRSAFLSWPVGRLRRTLPVAAVLALAAAAAAATAPAAQAAPTTTFSFTGGEQTYPVPPGATAVTITVVGAPGGTGFNGGLSGGEVGGNGASVTATVPLPAGTTTLYVEVGGPGTTWTGSSQPGVFNGGGGSGAGGTGGGASDVRTTSCGSPCNTLDSGSLASRLVVAGGGGGSAEGACGAPGGAAGDTTVTGPGNGGNGSDSCGGATPGGNGGFGGTAGGAGGTGSSSFPESGDNGALGQGGDTPTNIDPGNFGGGGGGGYYGGGGGGDGESGGSGGGGSSFWATGATGTSMSQDTTGTPQVQITPIIPAPDLSLSDTAPATAVSGQPYNYTLTATNTGGQDATSVTVTDTLPASAHFNAAATSQGSCTRPSTPKGGTVKCTVGSLAGGASVNITINVTPTKPGKISDAATVTASNVTADNDDAASATVSVQGT